MTEPWRVILEEDENGDVILPLGDEFMKEHGWEIGDTLKWKVKDGSAIITNVSKKKRDSNKTI